MMKAKTMQFPDIDKLVQSVISNLPEKVGNLSEEVQDHMRQTLSASLQKMDLVSRHEFDIQSAVLQRTREKVDEMEKVIKQLEEKLLKN